MHGKKTNETDSTPLEQSAALTALFETLSAGQTPNFLQMMTAISEISEIMTPDGSCPDCHRSPSV